jgi:hypothetical protein
MFVERRLGHNPEEQMLFLQRTIGNQATLRLLAQRSSNPTKNRPGRGYEQEADPANLTSRGATPSVSWDFSKVPLFPSDRANSHQASSRLTAPHRPNLIQPKLTIGRVDDPLEHDADRTADQVMRMPGPEVSVSAEEEEKAQNLQTKPVTTLQAPSVALGLAHEVLHSPGQPLDPVTQAFFEPRFGHDFSRIRVHADAQAADSARALGALAYTVGADIVFGPAQYQPNTTAGRHLLAHELAHTIQQAAGPVVQCSPDSGAPALPWYQRQQLEALEQKISGWTEDEKALARSLLTQWFALRNAGSQPGLIWTALSEQLLTQYTWWLVEADGAMQAYCRDHGLTVSEKFSGATCEPMFGEGHTRGQFKIDSLRSYINLTSKPEDVPLTTVYFWVFEYRKRTNPEVMAQADMIQGVLTAIAFGVGRVPKPTPSTPVPPSGGGGPSRSLPPGESPPVQIPAFSTSTEAEITALMEEHPTLTRVNAERAVTGPQGTVPSAAGAGGRRAVGGAGGDLPPNADITFSQPTARGASTVLRREVKTWEGNQGKFNDAITEGADQLQVAGVGGEPTKVGGEVLVQVPAGTDARQLVQRFKGSVLHGTEGTEKLGRYRSIHVTIVDPKGTVLLDELMELPPARIEPSPPAPTHQGSGGH